MKLILVRPFVCWREVMLSLLAILLSLNLWFITSILAFWLIGVKV